MVIQQTGIQRDPRPRKFGGSIVSGNYSEFEYDGTLVFHGDGTVWGDERVPLERAKLAGENVPVYSQFKTDGGGSAGVYAYDFDDGDEIFLAVQLSHKWKEGSIIYPHVHLASATDGTGKKTKLTLEYVWASKDDTFGNTTIVNRDVDLSTAYKHLLFDIPAAGIDGTGHTISSILMCRIARNAADSDNFTGDIFILEFDVHYQVDTVGSRGIITKENE